MDRPFVSGRCKPYPELAEPTARRSPYDIHDSRESRVPGPEGMVDLTKRQIYVPLEPRGLATTRHELGHVRWSPPKLPELDFDRQVMLAVEDARVNLGLRACGLSVDLDARGRAEVASLAYKDVDSRRWAVLVLRSIAAIGTNVDRLVRDASSEAPLVIEELTRRVTRRANRRLRYAARRRGTPEAPFETAEAIAREIAHELTLLALEMPEEAPRACCLGAPEGPPRPGGRPDRGGRPGIVPGAMSTVVAPLGVSVVPTRGGARGWQPAAEGSVVRSIHRFPIDGRIFSRPVRRRGGTVLIDTSGSMSLRAKDVDRILRETSGATLVAIYSGRGDVGELRVIASGGRRASAEHLEPFGGGNVVDVPALEWLAHQRGPRVWITDGGVTGVGDTSSPAITRRCRAICARAGIARVKEVEEAVAALQRRPGGGRAAG